MNSQRQQHESHTMVDDQSFRSPPPLEIIFSSQSQPTYSFGEGVLFPWKLHDMLDAAEVNGFTTVVSWLPDGVSFKVHDKETFTSLILQRYFDQTKYKSFQRQLNMWGFERRNEYGPEKGSYTHQYFVRGQQSLCCRMTRSKRPSGGSNGTKKSSTKTAAKTSSMKVEQQHGDEPRMEVEVSMSTSLPPTSIVTRQSACTVVSQDSNATSYCEDLNRSDHTSASFATAHCQVQRDICGFESYPEVTRSLEKVGDNVTIEVQSDEFEGQSFFPLEADDIEFWMID